MSEITVTGHPERARYLVDEDVGGAGGCEVRRCDGEYVGAAVEAVSEDADVEVASRGEWQQAE